jgi:DNA-binding MarR family transcriptional regulator
MINAEITSTSSANAFWNVIHTYQILITGFNELLKENGLSFGQFMVLNILEQRGEVTNMSFIQQKMVAKESNATRLIDKLLSKDFVTREVCADNRRKIDVAITEKGKVLLSRLNGLVKGYEEKFGDRLTQQELTEFVELLGKYRIDNND